ncbi:hypothetical protein ONZ45_g12954 [Pleurotus djamor]|nr:hypothetical protein ONZ45_g12954 [Pleurotus djamor]
MSTELVDDELHLLDENETLQAPEHLELSQILLPWSTRPLMVPAESFLVPTEFQGLSTKNANTLVERLLGGVGSETAYVAFAVATASLLTYLLQHPSIERPLVEGVSQPSFTNTSLHECINGLSDWPTFLKTKLGRYTDARPKPNIVPKPISRAGADATEMAINLSHIVNNGVSSKVARNFFFAAFGLRLVYEGWTLPAAWPAETHELTQYVESVTGNIGDDVAKVRPLLALSLHYRRPREIIRGLQISLALSPILLLATRSYDLKSVSTQNLPALWTCLGGHRPAILLKLERMIWTAVFNIALQDANVPDVLGELVKNLSKELQAAVISDGDRDFFKPVLSVVTCAPSSSESQASPSLRLPANTVQDGFQLQQGDTAPPAPPSPPTRQSIVTPPTIHSASKAPKKPPSSRIETSVPTPGSPAPSFEEPSSGNGSLRRFTATLNRASQPEDEDNNNHNHNDDNTEGNDDDNGDQQGPDEETSGGYWSSHQSVATLNRASQPEDEDDDIEEIDDDNRQKGGNKRGPAHGNIQACKRSKRIHPRPLSSQTASSITTAPPCGPSKAKPKAPSAQRAHAALPSRSSRSIHSQGATQAVEPAVPEKVIPQLDGKSDLPARTLLVILPPASANPCFQRITGNPLMFCDTKSKLFKVTPSFHSREDLESFEAMVAGIGQQEEPRYLHADGKGLLIQRVTYRELLELRAQGREGQILQTHAILVTDVPQRRGNETFYKSLEGLNIMMDADICCHDQSMREGGDSGEQHRLSTLEQIADLSKSPTCKSINCLDFPGTVSNRVPLIHEETLDRLCYAASWDMYESPVFLKAVKNPQAVPSNMRQHIRDVRTEAGIKDILAVCAVCRILPIIYEGGPADHLQEASKISADVMDEINKSPQYQFLQSPDRKVLSFWQDIYKPYLARICLVYCSLLSQGAAKAASALRSQVAECPIFWPQGRRLAKGMDFNKLDLDVDQIVPFVLNYQGSDVGKGRAWREDELEEGELDS